MNNKLDIISKGITLLFREHTIPGTSENKAGSKDLVKNILKTMQSDKLSKLSGGESDLITDMQALLTDMAGTDDGYDRLNLTQTIKMITASKPEYAKIILENIEIELDRKQTTLAIKHIRNFLNNYYRAHKLKILITQLSFKLNTGNIDISEIGKMIEDLQMQLDALIIKSGTDTSKVEVDFSNVESLTEMLEKVKDELSDIGKLATGWVEFNEMINGGFRRGEFVMIPALQHKYKSGTVGSLFTDLPMFNVPVMLDEEKKPLIVLHSLEDDASIVLSFIYNRLFYDEFERPADVATVTAKEMSEYIVAKLTVNGYHVKIIREDPTKLTYKDLYNVITDLEADGYEIHGWLVDYLSLVPTVGCITTGPMGTDLRDLFRRVRNFISSKKIAFITPHQLSTDAKQLIRNGTSDLEFPKEVSGKGYFSNSKQLDQEVDLEIYQHIARKNREDILVFQRGKHRGAPIIPDSKKYFGLFFPKTSPIPTNINRPDRKIGWRPGEEAEEGGLNF